MVLLPEIFSFSPEVSSAAFLPQKAEKWKFIKWKKAVKIAGYITHKERRMCECVRRWILDNDLAARGQRSALSVSDLITGTNPGNDMITSDLKPQEVVNLSGRIIDT